MGHLVTYSGIDAGTIVWARLCPVCRKEWIRCSLIRETGGSNYFIRHGRGKRVYIGPKGMKARPEPTDQVISEFAARACPKG